MAPPCPRWSRTHSFTSIHAARAMSAPVVVSMSLRPFMTMLNVQRPSPVRAFFNDNFLHIDEEEQIIIPLTHIQGRFCTARPGPRPRRIWTGFRAAPFLKVRNASRQLSYLRSVPYRVPRQSILRSLSLGLGGWVMLMNGAGVSSRLASRGIVRACWKGTASRSRAITRRALKAMVCSMLGWLTNDEQRCRGLETVMRIALLSLPQQNARW